jgi:glycosyltransferase involved in cell wall biosynthesis
MIHRLLLLSGSPVGRNTSFTRQLTLLAGVFRERGVWADVGEDDPAKVRAVSRPNGVFPSGASPAADAAVLLGYPDQFPSFTKQKGRRGCSIYLWAQFSSPPDCGGLGEIVSVPLTERTAHFLREGGCGRIGPVIPHGVDTRIYRPLPPADARIPGKRFRRDGSFTIGTVCANSPRKRLETVIRSFGLFHRMWEKSRLVVKTDRILSSDGFDLGRCLDRHGLSAVTTVITGELPDGEMCGLYNALDLYVNLSEWEGFCIPVIEAMACGVPVLCQTGQGPGEIVPYDDLLARKGRVVQEGKTALLHADPEEAAALMRRAASSPCLLRTLAEMGRRVAASDYSIGGVASRWLDCMGKYR